MTGMLDFEYQEIRDTPPEEFVVPTATIRPVETDDVHGTFVVEPLERGYGTTLGNPLRRMLLSSIRGTAVTWVKIEGVEHEYSTISHVKEDVLDIVLNVKGIHLHSVSNRPGKLRLEVKGEGRVCAGDIMTSPDFEIVNPELHLATLDSPKARLMMEMNVEQGKGYIPAGQSNGLSIGVLPVDAIFTPVRKVNYWVERTRVGQRTDFERLVVEVWTNGAITPSEAVRQASQELVEHFLRFSTLSETPGQDGNKPSWALDIPAAQYNMGVERLNLSARTLNCLKRASLNKLSEVLEKSRSELLRIRNFGEKSLGELDKKLTELGIQHPELKASAGVEAGVDGEAAVSETLDEEPDVEEDEE